MLPYLLIILAIACLGGWVEWRFRQFGHSEAGPLFPCYYCGHMYPVFRRNRIGNYDYANTGFTDLTQASTNVTTEPGWIEFTNNFALKLPVTFNNYQFASSDNAGVISFSERIR